MKVNILEIMSESSCYDLLRKVRWEEGLHCAHCGSNSVKLNGQDSNHEHCQKYKCHRCKKSFNDLTGTIFSGSQKDLKVWISCMYLMGLNISNNQISKELELSKSTGQEMTSKLRAGIAKKSCYTT